MTKTDIALYWTISFFCALTVVTAKVSWTLFGMGDGPPDDPVLAAHWHRKRRWLAIAEFSALPAFATIAVAATVYLKLPPVSCVLLSMAMGGLGFGFLLNALTFFAKQKLKMEDET